MISTNNINMIVLFFLVSILNTACSSNKTHSNADMIKIVINPTNKGWYFFEIVEDSNAKHNGDIVVNLLKQDEKRKIILDDYSKYQARVFDTTDAEISANMKLPGISFYKDKRKIFEFYNPSQNELQKVKTWEPLNRYIDSLQKVAGKLIEKIYQ